MIQNLKSLYFLVGLFVLINMEVDAQDSIVIEEIQTYYLDGTLKSIEENKFNAAGNITCYSSYETNDNTIYLHKTYYDSLNRPIKEVSISDNKIVDSNLYYYSNNGLKSEMRWSPDYLAEWKFEKWVIQYNEMNLPTNETWYDLTVFKNGDTISTLVMETRKFYDDNSNLITDSIFKGQGAGSPMPIVIDGKFVERKKINMATVTSYKYEGDFLVSAETIDEYGFKQIQNHLRNENGDYIRHEQISVSMEDTNSIITDFTYEFKKGRKIQTSETQIAFGFSKSRTYFDKNMNRLKHESLAEDGSVISRNEYSYDNEGNLKEELYSYLMNKRPINNLSNDPMGYRKVYIYKNTANMH